MKLRRARPHICGQTNKAELSQLLNTANAILKPENNKTGSITKAMSAKSILHSDKETQLYRQLALSNSSKSFGKTRNITDKYYDCIDQSLGRPYKEEEQDSKQINRRCIQLTKDKLLKPLKPLLENDKAKQASTTVDPSTMRKIKDIYKDKTNVAKVLRGWKIIQKGYISPQQLQLTLKSKFNIEVSKEECKVIVQKFTNFKKQNDKLDVQGMVTLFFAQNINSLLIHKSPLIQTSSQQRKQKVHQFLEGSNGKLQTKTQVPTKKKLNQHTTRQLQRLLAHFNTCASKLRQVYPSSHNLTQDYIDKITNENKKFKDKQIEALKTVIGELGFTQTVDSIYNMKDITQRVYEESLKRNNDNYLKQSTSLDSCDGNKLGNTINSRMPVFSVNRFKTTEKEGYPFNISYSPSSFSQLNSSFKSSRNQNLSPKQFYGQNQQKTRFGANPLHLLKEVNGHQRDEYGKHKIDQTLKQQQNLQKMRYQNKLERIRKTQLNQKLRIIDLQNKQNSMQQSKLRNMKHTLQAYNYVNFLKNHWQ